MSFFLLIYVNFYQSETEKLHSIDSLTSHGIFQDIWMQYGNDKTMQNQNISSIQYLFVDSDQANNIRHDSKRLNPFDECTSLEFGFDKRHFWHIYAHKSVLVRYSFGVHQFIRFTIRTKIIASLTSLRSERFAWLRSPPNYIIYLAFSNQNISTICLNSELWIFSYKKNPSNFSGVDRGAKRL